MAVILFLALVLGPFSVVYACMRKLNDAIVEEETPESALATSIWTSLLCLLGVGGTIFIVAMIPWLFGILLLIGLAFGVITFTVDGFCFFKHFDSYRAWLRDAPPPNLQVTMLDLYAAVIVYGLEMGILSAVAYTEPFETYEHRVSAWAVYLLLTAAFGLFAALDGIRWAGGEWPAKRRFSYVVRVIFPSTFLPVLAPLAWALWRRALWVKARQREEQN
ncbi:MAG: hypothetical protein M5U26_20590 [Planctomycetota bacterium]|nr:hypothetical protein [Planctomycetota bacterium]